MWRPRSPGTPEPGRGRRRFRWEPPGIASLARFRQAPDRLVALKHVARDAKRAHPPRRRPLAVAKEHVTGGDALEHADAVSALAFVGGREPSHVNESLRGLRPRLQA